MKICGNGGEKAFGFKNINTENLTVVGKGFWKGEISSRLEVKSSPEKSFPATQ